MTVLESMKVIKKYALEEAAIDRIIGMAWEDRTPFEAIKAQFGLSEGEVIKLMKYRLRLSSWRRWRARVQGRKTKHRKIREAGPWRFRSKQQRNISGNRPSKPR